MSYTYTRQTHDKNQVRYKVSHTYKRLLNLSIAMRNISEEAKELSDFLQEYANNRSGYNWVQNKKAQTNTTAEPKKLSKQGEAGRKALAAYHANKNGAKPAPKIEEEESELAKFQKNVVAWLLASPQDDPEIVAECAHAPLSMVKRLRTKLVEAGRLSPLHEHPKQEPEQH
jgi:hypothetical protein